MLHCVDLSNAATARDTTAPLLPSWSRTRGSSARPRTTSTGRPNAVDDLVEKLAPPQHRFEQRDIEVGSRDRERYARQPGPATDIDHPGAWLDELGHRGTVEDVPVPHPVHFPRAEQASLDPGAGEQIRIPLRQVEPVTEDQLRRAVGTEVGAAPCFT